MKKEILNIAIIIVAILFLNVEMDNSNNMAISGNVVSEPIVHQEKIEIVKSDLTECCSFINEKGQEKSCFALKDYSCDYCNSVC